MAPPAPEPTPTCDPWHVSQEYRESNDLPDCPTSTRQAPLTDAEVEQQWEEGERQRAVDEQQYRQESQMQEGSCADVTTYDNNWDNDMLCTRENGSQFYTDYDGAAQFEFGS